MRECAQVRGHLERIASDGEEQEPTIAQRRMERRRGSVVECDVEVTVAGSSRFRVTSHTASSTANAGDSATITWDTAGTEGAPYGVDRVDLLLSTDGGFTWDRTLLAATANDGSETIELPNITAVDARIIVRPVGNVFYAVSDAGISITSTGTPAPPTVVSAVRGAAQATIGVLPGADGGTPTSYQVTSSPDGRTCAIVGASGSCAVTGLTNGVAYTFTAVASNASGDSGVSSPSEPVTPATTPGAATNLAVMPSHETLTVTWSPPTHPKQSKSSRHHPAVTNQTLCCAKSMRGVFT